jgi:hypothetical protein
VGVPLPQSEPWPHGICELRHYRAILLLSFSSLGYHCLAAKWGPAWKDKMSRHCFSLEKNVLPLLEMAPIIDIWGRRSEWDVRIRFPYLTQPLVRWSVDLMMLSSTLIISRPDFRSLIYSAAANYLLSKFLWSS